MQLLPAKTREAAGLLPLWHLRMLAEEDHPETPAPRNYSSRPIILTRSSFTVAVQ